MPELSSERLLSLVVSATGGIPELTDVAPKPVVLNVPEIGRVRVYLWTTTPDRSTSGRPPDEHKSQIILPGAVRGTRQNLDLSQVPTFVLGFSPLFGVFVAWEARCHQTAGYSKNLQVKGELLERASREGWAIDEPRRTELGLEVRAAVHAAHLVDLLKAFVGADDRALSGEAREIYLSAQAPGMEGSDVAREVEQGVVVPRAEVVRQRRRIEATRIERCRKFSLKVLTEFDFMCAVCESQLTLLEGAHIIPVHDSRGVDEPWNGLALCKNHHKLFDDRILLIDQDWIVRVDQERIIVLEDLGRLGGYQEMLGVFRDLPLRRRPRFVGVDAAQTERMRTALRTNYSMGPAS